MTNCRILDFGNDYERVLREWVDITCNAIMLAYLDRHTNSVDLSEHILLIKSLHFSVPLRLCVLWGLPSDKHPSCLKHVEHGTPESPLYRKIRLEFEKKWYPIRNHYIAHYVPSADVPAANASQLLELSIMIGFYIEYLSQLYKNIYSHKHNNLMQLFMSDPGHPDFGDFAAVINTDFDLIDSLNKLSMRPLILDIKRYMHLTREGENAMDLFVCDNKKESVWALYQEHKERVKLTQA